MDDLIVVRPDDPPVDDPPVDDPPPPHEHCWHPADPMKGDYGEDVTYVGPEVTELRGGQVRVQVCCQDGVEQRLRLTKAIPSGHGPYFPAHRQTVTWTPEQAR